ncbi:MAG: isopentenyl-diphosphate Delta-isomerase [Candidatus Nanopelagicales bacterium]
MNSSIPSTELIVLLDEAGAVLGTAPKVASHHGQTPLHLAFSCYLFDERNRVLLTRRALDKRVFPGMWTNSVCGHPGPGEALPQAVARRAQLELGIPGVSARLVLPQFRYRAEMGGIVENEWCPVYAATIPGDVDIALDPVEVADSRWVPWPTFLSQVLSGLLVVSPWCALQVRELARLGDETRAWPVGESRLLPSGYLVSVTGTDTPIASAIKPVLPGNTSAR